jgi:cell division protease FtsH
VVVVAACNYPEKLDPALVRGGRLDRHIRIGLPDADALASILREHLEGALRGLDLSGIGLLLLGSTGADVERMVRGARRRARLAGRDMDMTDLVAEAGGDDVRDTGDLLVSSVHEAGHAVAAITLGLELQGVTLRGGVGNGGRTRVVGGSGFVTAADVYDMTVALLCGRAAEEVVLRRVTSGAGGASGCDLQKATFLAARSAAELGLEEDHGLSWTPLPERQSELSAMLAGDPRLALLVRDRLASAYGSALNLMERHQSSVQGVADRLLEKGALDAAEVRRILGHSGVPL